MTQPTGDGTGTDTQATLSVLQREIAHNARDQIHLTDRGNGRRFAEKYRDVVRYVVDRDEWLVRTEPHWAPDPSKLMIFGLTAGVIREIRTEAMRPAGVEDEDARRERMLGFALSTEGEGARLRMISCAREHPELLVEEDDLDAGMNLLATPSGVVDLLTGEFRDAEPDDMCTRVTRVEYDPGATSPLLDQYLETFVPEKEDQDVLFGVLGTILRGGNPGRLLPFFLGGTTSGKSQLLAALDRLLGSYICTINVSVFRGNLDDKPRPDLVRAMYHRIAYAVEASKTWELHSDQVKRITGGDAVPHRDLYGKSVEKVPRFTPLIVTNEMPRIKGADQALKRRLLVVRFDRTLPPDQEDSRVKERFVGDDGCLRALLARIVAGARYEALRDGVKWSLLPTRYAEAKLASFERLDHISEFIEWLRDREVLVPAEPGDPLSHCAKAGELHEWYGYWIKKHGDKQDKSEALNLKDFGSALRERGWQSKTSAGVRWQGVKLASAPGMWL